MSTIVDIVYPMLGTVVATEGLGVLKRLSFPIDEAPRWVVLDYLKASVR